MANPSQQKLNRNKKQYPLLLSSPEKDKFSRLWNLEDLLALGNQGVEFERLVGFLFQKEGYRVWTTPRSGDDGVDLFLLKEKRRIVVQCKQYRTLEVKVRPEEVRALWGVVTPEGADQAILVTTSILTDRAREWAGRVPMRVIECQDLVKWVRKVNRKWEVRRKMPERVTEAILQTLIPLLERPRLVLLGISVFLLAGLIVYSSSKEGRNYPEESKIQNLTPFPSQPGISGISDFIPSEPSDLILPTVTPFSTSPVFPDITPAPKPAPSTSGLPRVKSPDSSPCYTGQVKGNIRTFFYHEPGGPYYTSFPPDSPIIRCFDTPAEAVKAGFKPGLRLSPTPLVRKN